MKGRLVLGAVVLVVLGVGSSALAANAPTVPGQANCGDMAGPVWRFLVAGERRGSTGSHYTVAAVNMPCAAARALTAKMIRKPSPGKGLDTKILAGYTCTIGTPPGQLSMDRWLCRRQRHADADPGRQSVQLAPLPIRT